MIPYGCKQELIAIYLGIIWYVIPTETNGTGTIDRIVHLQIRFAHALQIRFKNNKDLRNEFKSESKSEFMGLRKVVFKLAFLRVGNF